MMTKFELVSNILNGSDAPDLKENVIYWNNGDKIATVNFDCNSRKASMIRKMAEKFPEEGKIFSDKKGGYMVASVNREMQWQRDSEISETHSLRVTKPTDFAFLLVRRTVVRVERT